MALARTGCVALLVALLAHPLLAHAGADAAATAGQAVQFEEAARRHLHGTWEFHHSSTNPPMEMTGTSTYFADGTARYEATLIIQGQSIPMSFEATWQVRGDKMITVVTKSSVPEAVPVGTESTDTIHELTTSVFRYTDDEEGMTITETRRPD